MRKSFISNLRALYFPALWVLALFFIPLISLGADVIQVPGDQPTIQQGIDAAVDGDVVLVADGTYTGALNRNLDPSGKRITIQSENGPASCVIDCEELHRAFYIHTKETRDCVIEGFTIVNGKPPGYGNGEKGEGICILDSASPVIRNCVIRECGYIYIGGDGYGPYGGGIYTKGGSPLIHGCLIEDNEAAFGGGIYCTGGAPHIVACTIRNNEATAYIDMGIPTPYWEGNGGGLDLSNCTDALIQDCVITNNSATADYWDDGDALSAYGGNGRIQGCTIKGQGGDIAVLIETCNQYVIDNTIVYIFNSYATPILHQYGGTCTVQYCDVEGGYPGTGNFDANPQFMNMANENFALKPGSPCIDAGDPAFTPTQHFEDAFGHSRLLDGDLDHDLRVDVGAHEYSNIRTAIIGNTTPGSTVQYRVRGLDGLYYMTFVGIDKLDPPPFLNPFGYLLVDFLPGFGPIFPLSTIPDDVYLTIPPTAPVGVKFYLLPICRDGVTYAGNFGAYLEVMIQ